MRFKFLLIWILLFTVVITGYSLRIQLKRLVYEVMSQLAPGFFVYKDGNKIILSADQAGHYSLYADVFPEGKKKGGKVMFLIDTGASMVTLPISVAKKVGIDTENLSYNTAFNTANGINYCAISPHNNIMIQGFVVEVAISVCNEGLVTPLLGMNFLQKIRSFSVDSSLNQMVIEF